MASSVDIAPNEGHPVVLTQLGVGESPGYDAIDFRRIGQAAWQEGVISAGAWQVSAHATAAMVVDVGASNGAATVQGESVGNQGKYVVAPHGGGVTLDIATAHATLPRLDQIVLRVYDHIHDGLGFNKASLEVVTGIATAGATLDTRSGAAGRPKNTLLLADVLVAATATSVPTANIRDRRRWGNGANWLGRSTTGNVSSTVTTMAAVDATNLQCRLEMQGNPVAVTLSSNTTLNSAAPGVVGFFIDGALPPNWPGSYVYNAAGLNSNASFVYVFVPSGGSHLFTATFASATAGVAFGLQASSTAACAFSVQEISDFSKNNGTI